MSSSTILGEVSGAFLEALGLSAERPDPRFFEELFLRFSMRFPYESLTRRDPSRTPAAVLEDFVESGTGSVGFERANTFLALARSLGFEVRPIRGERRTSGSSESQHAWSPHAGILASLDGREFLLDAALPVPILLPLEPEGLELPSPGGSISLARTDDTLRLTVSARGHRRERARFDRTNVQDDALEELQRAVPRSASGEALRFFDDRLLRYRDGRIEVLDRWSRLEYAVTAGRNEVLESLFLIPPEELPEEPAPLELPAATGAGILSVYDASELPAARLMQRLADPEALLRLCPQGTRFDELEPGGEGFSWRLTDESEATLRRERVTFTSDGVSIETIGGESPIASRRIVLHPEPTGTRVTLRAVLSRPVPARGLAESVRKTLVFHLASELLALSQENEPTGRDEPGRMED